MCPELDKNDTVCYPLYIFGRRKQRATSAGTSTSQEVLIMKKLLVLALAAMMLLKMAEDTESIVPKARLRQEGLYLLKYVQEHGNTYSLPRNLLIQFLESRD